MLMATRTALSRNGLRGATNAAPLATLVRLSCFALARLAHASPLGASLVDMSISAAGVDVTEEPVGSSTFWWKLGISAVLVLLGGAFAGLTLGLMGLDELHLRVLAMASDDPKQKANAQKVLKVMNKGRHWVLVVLLLGNVIVNESLPIFLDSAIGGGIAAIALSTTAIVIFGEIIPQAVSVRYGLSIGARCAPFVLGLMYILAPIAWPIAKLLDFVLGANEATTYKKAELKSFLQFHRTGEEPLRDDEISILNGVLELNTKKVETIMTPMQDVVSLSSDTILDSKTVDYILSTGYSRFPVHEPGQPKAFLGLLLIKTLLKYDPSTAKPVSNFKLSILPEAPPSINCFQALDYFQTGRAHLLLISSTPGFPGGALGVITLEDVIEEIISEEILDETDRYEDNQSKKLARRITNAAAMKGIVERERLIKEGNANANERTGLLRSETVLSSAATSITGGGQYGSFSATGAVPTMLPARVGVVPQDAQMKSVAASPQASDRTNGNANGNGQANGGHS